MAWSAASKVSRLSIKLIQSRLLAFALQGDFKTFSFQAELLLAETAFSIQHFHLP
jgi:hypothetical protein